MKVRESKKTEPANGNKKIVFGMKATMIIATIIPVLLALSIIGAILLLQVNGITDGLKKTEIDAQTKAASIQVDEYFAPYFVTAKVVADMDCVRDILEQADRAGAGFRFENSAYYREVMAEVSDVASNLDSGLLAVWYCGIANSELVSSDGSCSDASFVATERPWYKMVAANPGEVILTGAYEDYNSGVTVVTAAVGVYENGTDGLIGAIGMDIKIDALAEELGSISIGDAGYLTVYDSDNNIVYHRDSSRLLTALTDMNYSNNIYTALSGRTAASAMEYEEDGVSYCGSVILSSTTGWQILGCLPDAEFAQTSAAVRSTVNFTFGTCAVLIALIIIFIANGTINPIKRLNGVVTQLAEGDLDVDVKSKDKAEVKQLYENVGRLVDRLKTYILYIDEVSGVLDEIGHGNLVFQLEQDYVGEFDRLKVAMNEIQRNLSHTMYRIADSAAQVDSSTEQIASASQALAQGATEQASTVEQLSAAVHELSQHSVEESDRAVNLSKGVAVLGDELGRSNVQMQHMLGAMEEITTTSAEIEKIIKTIEDIAFQTNILALNAAVEAARAGTAGKGFAVVADEVRNLAAKSAEAAKSITVLIHSSLEAVDKGSGLASETAQSMGKVAKDVTEVVTAVEQFAARYQEQTASLGQITEGIEQITAVIQTNSATAEESAASSEELSGQAHLMKQLTDQFTMDERFH